MFQFPRLPSIAYVFSDERRRITGAGLPHSEIRGSRPVQRLTAAYRSRPRPSSAPGAKASTVCPYYLDGELRGRPKAITEMNTLLLSWLLVQFSSSAEAWQSGGLPPGGLSKLSSAIRASRGATHIWTQVRSTSRECLPRKEVIQPQLPLRLPCYDFTPITGPTFDGSLPCGLGHRLRVLLAFVV